MSSVEELTASNSYIEAELQTRLKAIEEYIDADVITLIHPIMPPFDDFIRDQIEDIKDKRANLLVILETEGGSIETTERIADVFVTTTLVKCSFSFQTWRCPLARYWLCRETESTWITTQF